MIRKFLFFTTLFLLVFGGGKAWAQSKTLVDFDFTNKTDFPNATPFSNAGETKRTVGGNDIYFYHNNTSKTTFSLTDDGLTFSDNNMSPNYFVAIPLTGIKGEITVTFYHDYTSGASFRYQLKDGATSYSTSDASSYSTVSGTSPIIQTITVNSEDAVFYFGRQSSSYPKIKRITITTPETAGKPKLTQFEFNPSDVYYYNGTSGEFVNNTTFEKNDHLTDLRVKLIIDPDWDNLGNNRNFTVTSSNPAVLNVTTGPAAFYKVSDTDKRIYVNNIKVLSTGTATLTFTFNGSDNYDGTASVSQAFTVTAAQAPTITMTTPSSTTDVPITSNIVLTSDRTITAVGETISGTLISGTLNETPITFTLTDGNTLTYTPAANLDNNTTYTVVLNANQVQGSNGLKNSQTSFTFTTVDAVASLDAVSDKVWNFTDWEAASYSVTTLIEEENIEFITANQMSVNSSNKSFTDTDKTTADNLGTLSFTKRLATGGASSASTRLVHFKVTSGSTIQVVALSQSSSSSRTLYLCKDSYNTSSAVESMTVDGTTMQKLKYKYTGENDADFYIGTSGGIGIYYIKVSSNKNSVSIRSAGSQPGASQATAITGDAGTTFSSLIVFTVDDITKLFSAGTISSDLFEVTSSDPSVIDVSSVTFSASPDDLSKSRIGMYGMRKGTQGGSAVITLRYKGNENYTDATTTFTRYTQGPQTFVVSLSDLSVQNGQKTNVVPRITNNNGDLLGFDGSGNLIVLDDDVTIDYNEYFDFTYSISTNSAGLTLDATDNSVVVSAKGSDYVGKTAVVTVTARPKTTYASSFTNGSANSSLTVTVIKRVSANYLKFYLDKAKTTQVTDEYSYTMDGSTSVFADFPNGRIMYVDLDYEKLAQDEEVVDEIWFSYNVGSSKTVSRASSGKNDYGAKLYLLNAAHGNMVPIHDDAANGDVYVNFQCYKRTDSGYEPVGSVIPVKFSLDSHSRPANVTYNPVSDGTLERSTAQSVDAIGTSDSHNDVYAKFSSTGTNYTIEGLLNEPNVIYDVERTGVFSTEVAARKISGVQINYAGDGAYVSTMTTMTYWYLFATTLKLSKYEYHIDLDDVPTPTSINEPTVTASYYDKVKKANVDASSGENITVSYSVANYNGAAVSVDASTGEITLGNKSGYAVVTVSYSNTNNITVNKRTSTMEDASTTYVIYLTKSGEHLPKIEPSSRKFYHDIDVTVTADKDWDAYYVIKNVGEAAPTAAEIFSANHKVNKNTYTTFNLTETKVVYAVAYDESSGYSTVISETYTLGEQVLPPYFVPAGLGASYPYNYYTETLGVEARTQTTGSTVYYTIGYGSAPADPVINGEGTIRYDGLQGINLTEGGTTYIKAIAYKDGIQSDVATAIYTYTGLPAPYYDVNDSGNHHTSGSVAVQPTDHITVGTNAVAPSGYTLVNYYTLDGSEPTIENGIRANTHFLVLKTVTSKAISVLFDALGNEVNMSPITTVTFTVSGSNVWEANDDTTPLGKLAANDGLIISSDATLYSGSGVYATTENNSGTKVNLKSLGANIVSGGNTNNIQYAQDYITVTFGGSSLKDWNSFTIADEALGSPLDGVGKYNIKCNITLANNSGEDAKDEDGRMYSHINTGLTTSYDGEYWTGKDAKVASPLPITIHEKTFKLPTQGTFVKFEPERDGDLTIWGLQQGAIHYQDDSKLCDRFVRRRPVYFLDEQGNSIQASEAVSSARLSSHWNTIMNGYAAEGQNWFTELGQSQDGVANNFYNQNESEKIYNMFMDYFQKRGDYADVTKYGSGSIGIGDPIQPIPIHTASRTSDPITERGGHNSDNSTDMTGYVLASGGYVRYTFPVKAGKTYYFFGHATKIGIRGFRFTPKENVSGRPKITIDCEQETIDSKTPADLKSHYRDQSVDVTLERNVNKDMWTALVLPFSVSATQFEKIFGAKAEVAHFKDIENDGRLLKFKRHKQQMIVAGTPIIIYSMNNKETNITFEGVKIEADKVESMTGPHRTYSFIGTFAKSSKSDPVYSLHHYDYYFGNNDGLLYRYDTGDNTPNIAVKGSRVWLRPDDPVASSARMLSTSFEFSDDDEDDNTTGIYDIKVIGNTNDGQQNVISTAVYNMKGQKLSEGSMANLPKGVYIVNGKKIVIE